MNTTNTLLNKIKDSELKKEQKERELKKHDEKQEDK